MPQPLAAGISRRLSSLRMNSGNSNSNPNTSTNSDVNDSERRQTEHLQATHVPPPSPKLEQEANEITPNVSVKPSDPLDPTSYPADLIHPGLDMIRVTRRKRVQRLFKLNLPELTLSWSMKDSSKVSQLEMEKIQSIRVGDDAKNYREELNVSKEFHDLWITVIYIRTTRSSNPVTMTSTNTTTPKFLYNGLKALHMIAPTRRNFEIMVSTLNMLSRWSKDQESLINCVNVSEFSKLKWENKMSKSTTEREVLSFEEVRKLTLELHIYMDKELLGNLFRQCDTENEGTLTFKQFQKFVNKIRYRPDLTSIYSDFVLSTQTKQIVESDFKTFLLEVQHEKFDDDFIHSLFLKFSQDNEGKYISLSGFANYLHSNYSSLLIKEDEDPLYYTHPLTDYFISSSHNTYLLGKQVHGYSSIEGYIHALQRGCRCIEIDIWDGDSGPIVTHGRTLTSSVDFKLVIETIRKYAFISTPYPLIISLEIKCSKDTQLKSAAIIQSTFGSMLITEPITVKSELPSPSQLKHKVLIKVKKSSTTTIVDPTISGTAHSSFSTFSSSTQSDDMYHSYASSKTDTDDLTGIKKTISNGDDHISSLSSGPTDAIKSIKKFVSQSTQKTPVVAELTSMSPYLVGIKFRNFSLPESKTFNHVFSFSDRALLILLRDKAKVISILKHNKRGMMRIYPSIVRFRSDNFNPIKFWELGCQMVATNWQIWDCGQQISESLFAGAGSGTWYSGYRLKPGSLRSDDKDLLNVTDKEIIKVKNLQSLEFNIEKKMEICIISGQQLPKPKDLVTGGSDGYTPWVEVEFYNVLPLHGEIIHISKNKTVDDVVDGINIKDDFNSDLTNVDKVEEDANECKRDVNQGFLELHKVDPNTSNPHWSARFRTRLAENPGNAFSPLWNSSCRIRYKTNKHDLSFVRIIVKSVSGGSGKNGVMSKVGNVVVKKNARHDYIIGSWCGKISDLKSGFRYVRLGDINGEELIYSSVFIKINKDL